MTSASPVLSLRAPRRWLVLGWLVCAGLGLCGTARAKAARAPMPLDGPVLVMSFEPVPGTTGGSWLREGVALLLAHALEARGLEVFDRETRFDALEQLQLPPQAPVSRASALRVGELLGAGTVVVGTYAMSGTAVEIHARGLTLSPLGLSPEVTASRPIRDIFEAMGSVADALAGPMASSSAWSTPPSVAAFAAMVQGLMADTPNEQERYLQASLKLAPDYAEARLALWALMRASGRHRAALAVVGPVAPACRLAKQARYAAALSRVDLKRYDEAFRELRTMLNEQASASVATALGVVQMRRTPTAQAGEPMYYFNHAIELDPDEPDRYFNLGYAYWRSGDALGSAYWLREAVRRNPADADAHFVLGSALVQLGATVEGQRERSLARDLSGDGERWGGTAGASGVPAGLERLSPRLTSTRRWGQPLDAPTTIPERISLARFHLEAGRRAFERDDEREARAALRRATFLSPYLAEAHQLLGRLYLRADRLDDAIAALRISLWSEERPDTREWLNQALARQRPAP